MKSPAAVIAANGAEALLAIALSLSAFVFVLGLPWQDLGVWPEQELTAAGLHLVSATAALALGLLAALRDRRALGAVTSAPVLAFASLGAVGLVLAPFVNDPWQSVHGTLEHEVGSLWHLEVAVLAAGGMVILASRYRKLLFAALFFSAAAVIALYALPASYGIGRPVLFSEWVGMLAGAVALAAMVRSRRLLSPGNAAALALLVAGVTVSGNRTVILAGLAVAFFAALGALPSTKALVARRSFRAAAAIAVSLAGLAGMWGVAPAVEAWRLRDLPPAAAGVASERPADHIDLMDGALGTLWSRSYMIRIIAEDLFENPSALIRGNGWGSFSTTIEKHAREVPGRMFPEPVGSASRTYWDSHTKANFHSHNVAAEALNSAGVPGLVLWLAFLGALAASSRAGFLASVGMAVISTFWFPVTHMTTAVAMLTAAGSAFGRPRPRLREAVAAVAPLPTALFASGLAMAAFLAFSLARLETSERRFEGVQVDRNPQTCAAITARFLPEEESSRYLYRVLVNKIMASQDRYKTLFDHTANVGLYSCTMRSHSLDGVSIPSLVESLEARARLASIGPGAFGIVSADLISWGADIDALLKAAPGRTDFIPPYILNLRSRKISLMASEAERYVARLNEDDPVREYLLSILADSRGQIAESKQHMRRALSAGYANLFPVSQGFIDSVVGK